MPSVAGPSDVAHHRAVGKGRREDQGRGARCRRGRLCDQAVGMDELLARVRRNLARIRSAEDSSQRAIAIGDFKIDADAFRVTVKNREVRLTPKEFELLLYLARHAGRVVTHRTLLLTIWGPNSVEQPEHLRVLVGQLRKKIDADGPPHYIVTEPWVGYRFEPAGEPR